MPQICARNLPPQPNPDVVERGKQCLVRETLVGGIATEIIL